LDGLQQVTAALAANDAELRSLIVNAEHVSREIRPVLATSDTTLKELYTEALPRLYKSLDSLNGLTRSLGGLSDKLARDPSTVIRGTVIRPGPGER
jgi:ABC-type transporter Mla subunit MlaD